jgi:hypothetical protein
MRLGYGSDLMETINQEPMDQPILVSDSTVEQYKKERQTRQQPPQKKGILQNNPSTITLTTRRPYWGYTSWGYTSNPQKNPLPVVTTNDLQTIVESTVFSLMIVMSIILLIVALAIIVKIFI